VVHYQPVTAEHSAGVLQEKTTASSILPEVGI